MKKTLIAIPVLLLVVAALWSRRNPVEPVRPADVSEKVAKAAARDDGAGPLPEAVPADPAQAKALVTKGSSGGCVSPNAVAAAIEWLVKNQNEDGSWGTGTVDLDGVTLDRVGITSLALASLLGSGYTHLSRDAMGDKIAGKIVGNAIGFLVAQQTADGRFATSGDAAMTQAMASLAIGEMYGMTGSAAFKEVAARAASCLEQYQQPDGSWSDATRSTWAVMALKSAQLGDLPVNTAVMGRAADYSATQVDYAPAQAIVTRLFTTRTRTGLEAAATALSSLPPAEGAYARGYYTSLALFQYDGPAGDNWKKWGEPFRNSILPNQAKDGSWPGRTNDQKILNTSLATMGLQVYYRYASILGANH